MFRLLIFLAALALAAWGLTWIADNPGVVTLTWRGVEYQVSLMLAFGAVLALAIVLTIVWGVSLRFVFRIPSLVSFAAPRERKREKGIEALSRGMVAVGAGDVRAAKHASDAGRLIGHEPMTKLLQAQSAQLAGDARSAVAAFHAMLDHHETHGLGLRGLHLEARRGGDHDAALQYAMRANARAPTLGRVRRFWTIARDAEDWAAPWRRSTPTPPPELIDKPTSEIAGARSSRPRWPKRRWSGIRKARSSLRKRPAGFSRRSMPAAAFADA